MTRKGKLRSTGDTGYESRMQVAIKGLEEGTFITVAEAARESKVRCRLCNAGGTPLITHFRYHGKLLAANAHCTIIQRGMADANKQIENLTKKKTRTSTKVKARFGTLPELKAAFQEEEVRRQEQERLNAEKEAQKTAETAARNARITTDTVLRTFDNSLSTYKRKDDLLTIAGALQIVATGTVPQLTARIKEYLHVHPDLASNPRFAGLFKQGGRRHANNSDFYSEPTVTVPAASLLVPLATPSHSYSSSVPLNQQFYYDLSSFAGSSHAPINSTSI